MTEKIIVRRPIVAALLSLVVVGLGQLYNGQLRRAVVLFCISVLFTVAAFVFSDLMFSARGVVVVYVGLLVAVGFQIFAVVDAFRAARRMGGIALRRYNRWYVYVPIAFVAFSLETVIEHPLESYSIPSRSMAPTLLVGDHLFANTGAYRDADPQRGDIAIFKLPGNPDVDYIKRLVGLPGDAIQIVSGILHINGVAVGRDKTDDYVDANGQGNARRTQQFSETLPGGRTYAILEAHGDTGSMDNTEVYTVPDGHYFAMGDNRDRSRDSRYLTSVGFIPRENVFARAEVLYASMIGSARWWQVWRWSQTIRFARIGMAVQ